MTSDSCTHAPQIPGYEMAELLGEGSMGSVYKARQLSTGQWVAIKLLRADPECPAERLERLIARFERETALCAKLHHPHLVRLLDRGALSSRIVYAVFAYLPGCTLRDHLVRHGALPPLLVTRLMLQVLDALACAHEAGIVHRDIKPQNIMVHGEGEQLYATVVDFGIGALLDEQAAFQTVAASLTREALGTPSYSAPEQLRGEPPTPRSDLYAWGLMFVECLTGAPVFKGYTLPEVYHAQLSAQDVPLPPALIGHPLHALLRKVLAKKPEDRPGDAAAVARMLSAINVANLVQLPSDPVTLLDDGQGVSAPARTLVTATSPGVGAHERRHVTAMYCSLRLQPVAGSLHDLDALEALQRDHLNSIIDIVHRYGGHMMGTLANASLFYFGYPVVSDRDGQRAARAALELVTLTERRAKLLRGQQGIDLSLSIGMHVGQVLLTPDMAPGYTAATAQALQQAARPGQIVLSETARHALARFVECAPHVDASGSGATWLLTQELSSDGFSFLEQGGVAMQGRDAELLTLDAAWQSTCAGQGGALLITGEPGIGKSRLAFEWASRCAASGGASLNSLCLPEQQHAALYPILRWVSQFYELEDGQGTGPGMARLQAVWAAAGMAPSHLSALLLSWISITPEDIPPSLANFSPEMQKQLLLDGLERALLAIGEQGPACLLLEDVHWIDQSSAAFLNRLIPQLAQHRICLAMTARRDELRWAVPEEVGTVALHSLDGHALGALLSSLLEGLQLDPQTIQTIQEHTAGIPLYVAEFTALLQSEGLLRADGGVLQLDVGPSATMLPTGLRGILGHALQRVGPAKETAQLAAAIGREFDHDMLSEVSPCDEGTLQAHLQSLIDSGLIVPLRRVGNEHYLFKHALLRSAAYDSLPTAACLDAHAGIAAAMQARIGDNPNADWMPLARHHAAAEQFDRAVPFGLKAVGSALQRALHDDALELAETVLGWLRHLPEDAHREQTLQLLGYKVGAMMSKFGWADERVRAAADEAYAVALKSGRDADVGAVLWLLATYHHVASHRSDVRDIVRELLQRSQTPGAEHLRLPAHAMAGISSWIDGRFLDARDHLEQALALPDDGQDRMAQAVVFGFDCRIWARAALANVYWYTEEDEAIARQTAHDAVEEGRKVGHVPSLGVALMYLSFIHQYGGDMAASGAVANELRELGLRFGLPALIAYGTIVSSWAASDTAEAEGTIAYLNQLGCRLGQTLFHVFLAEVKLHQGKAADALTHCDEGLRLCDEIDERYYTAELLRMKARVLAQLDTVGNQRAIQDTLNRAEAVAQGHHMYRAITLIQKDRSLYR